MSIYVDSNINFSNKSLYKLPLKFKRVSGYFDISSNNLISLEGCPKEVGYDFDCSKNDLESLEHCPRRVGGKFNCGNNNIYTFGEVTDLPIPIENIDITGSPIGNILGLFNDFSKIDLFNEFDPIRKMYRKVGIFGREKHYYCLIMERLNTFLDYIGLKPVRKVDGYVCIN